MPDSLAKKNPNQEKLLRWSKTRPFGALLLSPRTRQSTMTNNGRWCYYILSHTFSSTASPTPSTVGQKFSRLNASKAKHCASVQHFKRENGSFLVTEIGSKVSIRVYYRMSLMLPDDAIKKLFVAFKFWSLGVWLWSVTLWVRDSIGVWKWISILACYLSNSICISSRNLFGFSAFRVWTSEFE